MRNRLNHKPAVILVGHGSRQRGFQSPMVNVARELKRTRRYSFVLCAYLEVTPPSIAEAVGRLAHRGARHIRVLPYFVLGGKHVMRDIPALVKNLRRRYAGVARITLCPYIGYDPGLVTVVKKRLKASS